MKTSTRFILFGILLLVFTILVIIPPVNAGVNDNDFPFYAPGLKQYRLFGPGYICHCPISENTCGCVWLSPPEEN